MSDQELKTFRLCEIFSDTSRYRIPIYQRNFAWGEKEILELLLDIYNQYKNDKGSNYYIGSLVVSHKENDNIYDVIDGQQRLIVITLIYIYLREKSLLSYKLKNKDITISFEIRDEINEYLRRKLEKEEINEAYITEENGLQAFEYAFNVIDNFFNEYLIENIKKEYIRFLFNNIQIIRIILPKDTDLIEYFEIMNTRGEQLELHDILKARLLNLIEKDEKRKQYSYIWEIVSDFSIYPSYKLDIENIEFIIDSGNIFVKINEQLSNIGNESKLLSDIFNEVDTISAEIEEDEKSEPDERFQSIIDFPNFLLIALKLYSKDEELSLDIQKLLINFDQYLGRNNFVCDFILKLLKYRFVFDNYIIKKDNKKENNEKYRIQSYKNNNNEKYYINTITNKLEEDEAEDDSNKLLEYFIIHLQTILENLNPTKQNKTWIYEALNSFINTENKKEDRLLSITNTLWTSLRGNVSNLDSDRLGYPDISRKLFYYIDFLILLENKLFNNYNEINNIIKNFEFASVSSIEHIYSQKLAENTKLDNKVLHCIANLCLISSSQNTSLGQWDYNLKKKEWEKFDRKYSLKQALVFSKYNNWEEDNIKDHQEQIINLLEKYKKQDNLYSIIMDKN